MKVLDFTEKIKNSFILREWKKFDNLLNAFINFKSNN